MESLVNFESLFPPSPEPEGEKRARGMSKMLSILSQHFNDFDHSPGKFMGGGVGHVYEYIR
jgi:hypothetical protein